MGHLMAKVHSNNELLEQAPCFSLSQSPVMGSIVALNEVNKVSSRSVLADNSQVV